MMRNGKYTTTDVHNAILNISFKKYYHNKPKQFGMSSMYTWQPLNPMIKQMLAVVIVSKKATSGTYMRIVKQHINTAISIHIPLLHRSLTLSITLILFYSSSYSSHSLKNPQRVPLVPLSSALTYSIILFYSILFYSSSSSSSSSHSQNNSSRVPLVH